MNDRIVFSKNALRFLERVACSDYQLARRLEAGIRKIPDEYKKDKMLTGELKGLRRHRVGNYRIVYSLEGKEIRIFFIIDTAHRREVYR